MVARWWSPLPVFFYKYPLSLVSTQTWPFRKQRLIYCYAETWRGLVCSMKLSITYIRHRWSSAPTPKVTLELLVFHKKQCPLFLNFRMKLSPHKHRSPDLAAPRSQSTQFLCLRVSLSWPEAHSRNPMEAPVLSSLVLLDCLWNKILWRSHIFYISTCHQTAVSLAQHCLQVTLLSTTIYGACAVCWALSI